MFCLHSLLKNKEYRALSLTLAFDPFIDDRRCIKFINRQEGIHPICVELSPGMLTIFTFDWFFSQRIQSEAWLSSCSARWYPLSIVALALEDDEGENSDLPPGPIVKAVTEFRLSIHQKYFSTKLIYHQSAHLDQLSCSTVELLEVKTSCQTSWQCINLKLAVNTLLIKCQAEQQITA